MKASLLAILLLLLQNSMAEIMDWDDYKQVVEEAVKKQLELNSLDWTFTASTAKIKVLVDVTGQSSQNSSTRDCMEVEVDEKHPEKIVRSKYLYQESGCDNL